MGFNTVAVLYNDFDFDQPDMGKRIKDAMRGWSWRDRSQMATHFGAGQVISQAHADWPQVVVVGRNTGKPIEDCEDLDYATLARMAECLIRHGWKAQKPSKKRIRRATPIIQGEE